MYPMRSVHSCLPQNLLSDLMRLLQWRHCCRALHTIVELVVPLLTRLSLSVWKHITSTRAQIKYTSRQIVFPGDLLIMRHAIKTISLKVLGHKVNAQE